MGLLLALSQGVQSGHLHLSRHHFISENWAQSWMMFTCKMLVTFLFIVFILSPQNSEVVQEIVINEHRSSLVLIIFIRPDSPMWSSILFFLIFNNFLHNVNVWFLGCQPYWFYLFKNVSIYGIAFKNTLQIILLKILHINIRIYSDNLNSITSKISGFFAILIIRM